MRFQNSRLDLSEWVIHFVHDEETAPKDEQGYILDICGVANVVTYDAHSDITGAFLQLEYAQSLGDLGYFIYAVTSGFKTNCVLGAEQAVADAAAKKLTELLGQKFYVYSPPD